MPPLNMLKKKYQIAATDLPNASGPNVVVVESFDTEEGTDFQGVPFVRHSLYLVGWELPLRLNNLLVEMLEKTCGPNQQDAIGKKIILIPSAQSAYGKTEIKITIHPFAPSPDATPATVPPHLWVKSQHRASLAGQVGVQRAPVQFQVGTAPKPALPSTGEKLGTDRAAELCLLLKERGRNWDWLSAHFASHHPHVQMLGVLPPDVDSSIRGAAWAVLRNLPVTVGIADRPAEKLKLIESWVPPAGNPKQDVIDMVTGEVIDHNDIPF
jgi:hypothetical protein